jgi:hypothetical protein
MTKEEIKFLIDHKINFDSVKLGFTRNIPFEVLGEYERLYRKYLDNGFILTYWCGSCVFDMLERLIRYCEDDGDYIAATSGVVNESLTTEKPKRGRPKKK